MDTIRTRLRQVSHMEISSSPLTCNHGYASRSLSQSPSVGAAEEVAGAQRMELRFVTSEAEEEEDVEAGPGSDITALVLSYRHGYRRAGVFLCVCGVVIFMTGTHTHTNLSVINLIM